MIYAYIRETSNPDSIQSQRVQIEEYAATNQLQIQDVIVEPVVAKGQRQLPQLQILAEKIQEGDTVLACRITDFGVSIHTFLDFLNTCFAAKGSVQTIEDGYCLHHDDTTESFSEGIALALQLTRQFTSQRTIEALQKRKQQGVRLGRPSGVEESPVQQRLLNSTEEIRKCIAEGMTRPQLAQHFKVGITSLYRFLKDHPELTSSQS